MAITYELNIIFNKSYIKQKKLNLLYNLEIIELEKSDYKDLKERILSLVPLFDKKYLKLESFDKKKAVFSFDSDKWLKENIGEEIRDTIDSCEKKIKVGRVPIFISQNIHPLELEKIVQQTFRNYLEKNNKLKNKISTCVKTVVKDLSMSYFDFSYDTYDNSIDIKLKAEFRANPMLFVKPIENPVKRTNFDKTVYDILKILR